MRLILASTSPRRRELLALLQVPFEAVEPTFVEQLRGGLPPDEQARLFAEGKAQLCGARFPHDLVLGSDTLISIDEAVLGKPADSAEAGAMLRRLRGRDHLIHTAVALRQEAAGRQDVGIETVRVWVRSLSEAEVEAYVRSEEGMGKAGAYSIQGAGGGLIERIEGDYTAVVGLPLRLVAGLLTKHGMDPPVDVEGLYRKKPYQNWGKFE
jgi:septum formation protein